jgi:ectoine hydroxylase-related dioxygenase (phytanoyl-CoA dioxygenase family)
MTQTDRELFYEQGYFFRHAMFTPAEIDELLEHIDPFVKAHQSHLETVGAESISRSQEISFTLLLAEKDPWIREFVRQPRLAEIAASILGPDVQLYWDQAVYKYPGTPRDFPWHQDNGYGQVFPETYLSCWLAMEDAYIENGCIWVLPNTHKQGLVPHQDTDIGKQCYFGDEPGLPIELKKGSLALFSSLLFHRSGPNLSDNVRKGYIIQYAQAGVREKDSGKLLGRIEVAQGGQPVDRD